MKTILILTNFSANAACATEVGLALSVKLKCDVLLFNTYIDYAALPYESGGNWDVHSYNQKRHRSLQGLESQLEGLESLALQLNPNERKPAISLLSNNCDLGVEVAELLKHSKVEMVIMGARADLHDDPLSGADTNAVIKNSTRPVLVVPLKTNLNYIRKVIFATDFEDSDLTAIRYLMKIGKLLNYQLEVVHVNKNSRHTDEQGMLNFKEQLNQLDYQGLSYREVNGKDLVGRLNKLTTEDGPAILALRHHQLAFFFSLFTNSKTKAALARQHSPLLIFPSKML